MDRAHARPLRRTGEALNPPALSSDDVLGFHRSLSNWGRWGGDDQLGALRWITAEKRAGAARLVQSGRSVGCSRPLPTEAAADNERPVVHLMAGTASEGWGADYFALAPHGFAVSHLDALCHVFHEGRLYNGYPAEQVTAHGALALAVDALRDGVVSRGVLLDIPALRGVPWLEAGDAIGPGELERAEAAAGLRVEPGDVLHVRTGRWALRAARGPWNARERIAGLHASCLPWLFERRVAALGCDGVSDVLPSGVEGVPLPIHSVAIVAMGLHLLDNLDLDPLADACREERRHAFQLVVAPLVIARGTASPVNPIAIF